MSARAWIHTVGSFAQSLREQLIGSMDGAEIELCKQATASSSAACILLFEETDASLLSYIRNFMQQNRGRLLGIAATPETLTIESTWALLHAGMSDVWPWGGDADQLVRHLYSRIERWNLLDQLLDSPMVKNNLVGESEVWRSSLSQLVETARFTDASVLITGESGVGKELAARLMHTLDGREEKGELVILDCTTIVPELSGSEFFGHEKGAFTGATGPRDGAFALADGGTLFLDEVGELPLPLQAQLLRVVQEGKYKRVGGNEWHSTDFRLVCATNRNLVEEIAAGHFRNDLNGKIRNSKCR